MAYIIEGRILGFYPTAPEDITHICNEEKDNYPFVSFNSVKEHRALLEDPDCLHMTIRKLKNDSIAGHILLKGLNDKNKTLEFRRLVIYEKGRGYGREVIQLLKRLSFEKLRFHRLWLDVFDDNIRAIHLYESEGFIYEGTLRDSFKDKEVYRSQRIYSMLIKEYNSVTAT